MDKNNVRYTENGRCDVKCSDGDAICGGLDGEVSLYGDAKSSFEGIQG